MLRTRVSTIVLFIFACCASLQAQAPSVAEPALPVKLRVLSFNIEWGGTHVAFDKVIEAIRRSGADMAGIQEAEGNLRRIADRLGWHYNERQYAISRFPLVEPPGAAGKYVYVEVAPGRMVALANVHLPSDPEGTGAVRDGASAAEVIQLERTARLPYIEPYLSALAPLLERSIPAFMTGDFNAPSHRDWTEASVGSRPFVRYALDWPVSQAISAAGWSDSWREVYPDPVAHPGLTWWAGRPPLENYTPGENDPQDRIDFIWFAGPVEVLGSQLLGEAGGPEVAISVKPWPSDHRAVLSTFSVVPAVMPFFASASRRVYQQGDTVEISLHGRAQAPGPGVIRLTPQSSSQSAVTVSYLNPVNDHQAALAVEALAPGHYLLGMGPDSRELAEQGEFWVLAAGAEPAITVGAGEYRAGEPIRVSWQNAPGYRNDYLALYPYGEAIDNEAFEAWAYTAARPEGELVLMRQTLEGTWPLPPGRYVVRLLKDDGYEHLAESAPFTVK